MANEKNLKPLNTRTKSEQRRIQSMKIQGGEYCGDWLVIATDAVKAMEKFFREYPAHRACRVSVEPFDPEANEAAKGLYKAVKDCGCIF